MAARYSEAAAALLAGDGILYPRTWPERSDTGLLSRPPGYPAFVAAVYGAVGRATSTSSSSRPSSVRCPAAAPVPGGAGLGSGPGLASGLLGAVSPPLAYNAVLVTPDSLAALLVLAVVVLVWAGRRGARRCFAGAELAGIATWLRPNLLLLAPALLRGPAAAASAPRAAGARRLLMSATAASWSPR